MLFIVATKVVASRSPESRLTGMPTARAKRWSGGTTNSYNPVAPAKVTNPPQKFEKKVKKQREKTAKTKVVQQKQNEQIREFTLMISKLLFQLSQQVILKIF